MTAEPSVSYDVGTKYQPPALLRRVGYVDQAYLGGVWRPTTAIVDWQYGHGDDVDEITEDEELAPDAFPGPSGR